MKKIINITMLILICVGLIFGAWRNAEISKYRERGISTVNSKFCLYERIQSFLGGIISIWVGINLLFKPSSIAKVFGKANSPTHLVISMCFGLFWLAIGILSFWNIYSSSNLYSCGVS